jgi:hypothetical protein
MGGLSPQRVSLVNGSILGGAVGFTGGSVDEPIHPMMAGGLQKIQGATTIGRYVLSWGNIRIRDRNQGGQMKDDLLALDHPDATVRISNIAQNHFYLIFDRGRELFLQAPIIPGIIAGQGSDPGSQLHQSPHQMAPNETPGNSHQDASRLPFHCIILYPSLQKKSMVPDVAN